MSTDNVFVTPGWLPTVRFQTISMGFLHNLVHSQPIISPGLTRQARCKRLMKNLVQRFVLLSLLCYPFCSLAQQEDTLMPLAKDFANVQEEALWKELPIPVCWENASPTNARERQWVRDAILETWEKESALHSQAGHHAPRQAEGYELLSQTPGHTFRH